VGLDARLMTLLCEKITVAKSEEVKTECNWQNHLRKAVAQKVLFADADKFISICSSSQECFLLALLFTPEDGHTAFV
jgi:hypothetical protein